MNRETAFLVTKGVWRYANQLTNGRTWPNFVGYALDIEDTITEWDSPLRALDRCIMWLVFDGVDPGVIALRTDVPRTVIEIAIARWTRTNSWHARFEIEDVARRLGIVEA